jgi:hypothetical protein
MNKLSNQELGSGQSRIAGKTALVAAVASALTAMSGSAWSSFWSCSEDQQTQNCENNYATATRVCDQVRDGAMGWCGTKLSGCMLFWEQDTCDSDYKECEKTADEAKDRCYQQAQDSKDSCLENVGGWSFGCS